MTLSNPQHGKKILNRGALGRHTFYVGLSSNPASILEIPYSEHYLINLGKLLKLYCVLRLKKIVVVVHKVCTLFSLDRVKILHTTYKGFENNVTIFLKIKSLKV